MRETASHNPLVAGLAQTLLPQPCALVIFGGAGDLARRKLLPALYNLLLDGLLPASFAVVGFARSALDDAGFRAVAREGVERHSRRTLDEGTWQAFERRLFWVRGGFDEAEAYPRLRERLSEIEPGCGLRGSRIYYLSVPPSTMVDCVQRLADSGMARPPAPQGPWDRIIVEKPIGRDLETARELNAALGRVFDESQTFRIDHYLGKETVQSLLVMRFANAIFEPLWNQKYVDHVQITVAEAEGVGSRANYYEEAGALRDMVQNHLLQLLSLTAAEPPWALTADVVRDQKLAVLNCLRPLSGAEVDRFVVRAQYDEGFVHGVRVPGYAGEKNVRAGSTTETYVGLECFVDNWRWAGVPFYLRTGKRLPRRASEIAVQFKDVPHILFNVGGEQPLEPNVLTVRIQPDEGMSLRIATKLPGPKVRIYPVRMDFRYGTTFGEQSPEAYERLLLDVMAGDATLFMRRDAVEAAWTWVDNVLEAWARAGAREIPRYAAGSWGPREADELMAREGRRWRTP